MSNNFHNNSITHSESIRDSRESDLQKGARDIQNTSPVKKIQTKLILTDLVVFSAAGVDLPGRARGFRSATPSDKLTRAPR